MASAISPASPSQWSDLPPDLLGRVIALLPFPADRARLRAVCRAWRSAARHPMRRQLPWIVLPDGSFCTVGDDGAYLGLLPGLPENITCVGATDDWLALDCTDDVLRRTPLRDLFLFGSFAKPKRDVKHRHNYLLYNPFSGETVPLPKLDSVIGHVAETFEVRKVLMRSSSPDDVIAITTNSPNNNLILHRHGKGGCIVSHQRVFDVAFLGDKIYGITPAEELVAIDLADDDDGAPTVTKIRRSIGPPDGEQDLWGWMYDGDDGDDDEHDEAADDDAPNQGEGESFRDDDDDYYDLPDGKERFVEDDKDKDECQAKDIIELSRYLVVSCGELLLVRHYIQTPPFSRPYTRNVELLKADVKAGKWVPVLQGGLPQGQALFLSRSFSKSTPAYEDIKEGFVYFGLQVDDVFDTRSWTCKTFSMPWERTVLEGHLLTWLFPPKLVV
ncbi:hypothetical protein ACP70R_002752 [Stipagrostis hirtigluma subsp. patula]